MEQLAGIVEVSQRLYAIMILDIRDSTRQMSRPNMGPDMVVTRVRHLISSFSRIAENIEPQFMKSTGDGLFCVWDLGDFTNQAAVKLEVLRLAVDLDNSLSKQLKGIWQGEVQIGIGLTAGTLYFVDDPSIRIKDYFGYFANLASKLQDAARPAGLVVDGTYLSPMSDSESDQIAERFKLVRHEIPDASPLHNYQLEICYTSPSVMLAYNWTCLAWPGFAITEYDKQGTGNQHHRPLGLNTQGITVVTHEGLQGNIGSLAISRAYAAKALGDPFEIYIDDYDALQFIEKQHLAPLQNYASVTHEMGDILARVSPSLRRLCWKSFAFIPIRCGVNALAAHSKLPVDIANFRTYAQIFDYLTECSSDDLAMSEVGLYDNMGATLPLLLMMMDEQVTHKSVFDATVGALTKSVIKLNELTKKKGKFKRYSTIASLARDLCEGSIKLVIGGGAWLACSHAEENKELRFHVPKESGGLLWVEGAALSAIGPAKAKSLLTFLESAVLSDRFQEKLPQVRPYPSSPTTRSGINKMLHSDLLSPVCAETARIFKSSDQLSELLSIRTVPANDPEAWVEAFREIMAECCHDPIF
jgi:class 3 adenylate cyclase